MKVPTIRRQPGFTLAGRPLVAVAFAAQEGSGEAQGTARGIIAVGDRAEGSWPWGGRRTGSWPCRTALERIAPLS